MFKLITEVTVMLFQELFNYYAYDVFVTVMLFQEHFNYCAYGVFVTVMLFQEHFNDCDDFVTVMLFQEHFNYYAYDDFVGPLVLSMRLESDYGRDSINVILRSVSRHPRVSVTLRSCHPLVIVM